MGYFGYYYYDATYLLVILGAILSVIASARVNGTFSRYSRVRSMSGMTGAQAARRILDRNGLYDVKVEHIRGNLTDHYDPRTKVLRLSDATYGASSVAAVGVAAHECGHAVQDSEAYEPLRIRSKMAPAANFGSRFGLPIFIAGLIFGANEVLMQIGIWVFLLAVLFQLITLPVEFDASKRALAMLTDYGILGDGEVEGSRKVLKAAAMTYVAAAAASVLNLLRLILIARSRDRD
ncbi:MAG TPA: zinc metallopeptidase [Candidatus Eisenbergiella pullicola]|nr:zinc metallopeptidase [Candidatus Eisenbergiella pullicola]